VAPSSLEWEREKPIREVKYAADHDALYKRFVEEDMDLTTLRSCFNCYGTKISMFLFVFKKLRELESKLDSQTHVSLDGNELIVSRGEKK
jgi:hypothetical protein